MSILRFFPLSALVCAVGMAQATPAPKLAGKYGDIPLAFEENRGQVDSQANFVLRGGNLNLFVTKFGAVLAMKKGEVRAAVRLELVGASKNATVAGESLLAGRSSYFRGSDPAKWVTAVPHYEKVRISEVRSGVDLLCYANEKQFEYDLVVKPGTRPGDIRLRFAGAEKTSLTPEGDLKIQTAAGDLIQHKPRIWQQSSAGREMVAGRYEISKSSEVSVVVGRYDHGRELVIDPVVSYSTFLGGKLNDQASAIAVDASGNAYITGQTSSVDFPTTVGAYSVAEKNTSIDVFIAKLNPTGTGLLYSTYLGGTSTDIANAIAIDSSGNAYVTGSTYSADFPVTAGVFQAAKSSSSYYNYTDVFVTKLNASGTVLVYSTYIGGSNSQSAAGIQVDSGGNAYIAGSTSSTNFPTTSNAYATVLPGSSAAFITKVDPAGAQLVYSTYLGGSSTNSAALAIALDTSSNAYVTGVTLSSNFPTTSGAYQTLPRTGTSTNAFVAQISADGTKLNASTYLGGGSNSYGSATVATAIALDSSNNPYVTGYTQSLSFPTTPSAFSPPPPSSCYYYNCPSSHAFVTKLNPSLSSLTYSSYLGGSGTDAGNAIAVDSAGNAYVAGYTTSTDFPITPGSLFGKKNPQQNQTAFLTQVDPSGSYLTYSTLVGGTGTETAAGVAVDANLGAYVTGYTSSSDFPVTAGAYQTVSTDPTTGYNNAFVTKLDLNSQVTCTLSISPPSYAAPLVGGTSSFAITLPQGCPWVLYNPNSTITINGPTHGFGNATVNFSLPSNAGSSYSSSASILIGSSTFSVTQPAGSCSTPVISPASASFGSAGGLDKISIAVPSGCTFTAKGAAPWITVTSGSSGNGSGSISYFVDRDDFASRSTSLLIDGINFPVTQTGAGCSASASVVSGTGGSGGTGYISLTTSASSCAWKGYSLASWIQLGTNGGSGSATVGITMAPNPGTISRTGQIQIAGQTVVVSQAPGAFGTPSAYTISTIAGNGNAGFSGDGGPAISAMLNNPSALAFDASGNLFIADYYNRRVRKVGVDGSILTVAGNGSATESGNGGAATAAGIAQPFGIAFGTAGDLYIGDQTYSNGSIRKVTNGVISTLATGVGMYSLAVDSANNLYAGGYGYIQKVRPNGTVSVIAGSTITGFSGDGGPPASAGMGSVFGLAFDGASNLYLSDQSNQRVRRIAGNVITTVAGTGTYGFNGDGPATSSTVYNPNGLATDPVGNVLIVDTSNSRIRRLTPSGNLSTIAGSGNSYYYYNSSANGDGGPALSAAFGVPQGIAIDPSGNIAVSDSQNNVVRLLTPTYSFCSFTISPSVAGAPNAGGFLAPAINTSAGCVWNVFSSASWITLASVTGTGPGATGLQIAANNTGSARTGTVSIAGQTFTVTQATAVSQTITFGPVSNVSYGAPPVSLTATATSGLPVTFTSNTLANCTVSGNTVTIVSGGICSITASQPGNANYGPAPSVTQSFTVQVALRFVAITPCRLADTRNPAGAFGGPSIAGQTSRDFIIPNGSCQIPTSALAYSVNVAVVPQGPLGFLTIWPAGGTQPLAATLNSDGRIKSNAAIVSAGINGAISVFATNTTDVILDINGYFVPATNNSALAFYPVTPCRIADTRLANGPLGGPFLTGQIPRTFPILSSSCGVPATAQAYSLNFAAVPRGTLGFLTAWPTGQTQPFVASLNAPSGTVTANAAIVPAGTNGSIDIFATNNTDLVIDINGYFAPAGAGGLSLYGVQPCRVLDSRNPAGTPPFAGTMNVNVTGSSCGTTAAANAFVFNATVVPAGGLGFLTLWPQGTTQPIVASLNALDGAVTGNMAIVPTTNGSISAFATNPTHLVLDIFGFFAP